MTTISFAGATFRRESWLARTASTFDRVFDGLLLWHARRSSREHLAMLDDRLLRDIGVSRADAEREYSKPFWRP